MWRKLAKIIRNVVVLMIVAACAYAAGDYAKWWGQAADFRLERAQPLEGLYRPGSSECVEPTEQERALIRAAVDVLAFPDRQAGFLAIGSHQFLSRPLMRIEGKDVQFVCDPIDQYERASELISTFGGLRGGRLTEYGLKLIVRLPRPSDELIAAVAASAFHEHPQESDIFPRADIRPIARSALAAFGSRAQPYAGRAYEQIGIDDAMGTGAAQIAVAAEHPDAMRLVEKLMADQLARLPRERVVPWDTRNRLYEMAHAISMGGDRAKDHIVALRDLMTRKVQSKAPPFGLIERPPKRMCDVLARVTRAPVDDLKIEYCSDRTVPYEQ